MSELKERARSTPSEPAGAPTLDSEPVRPKSLTRLLVSTSSAPDPAHDPCVLFVDDDPSNLVVWEAICCDELTVLTAQSASEALALMANREVGVLVADQRMPGTTGVELL